MQCEERKTGVRHFATEHLAAIHISTASQSVASVDIGRTLPGAGVEQINKLACQTIEAAYDACVQSGQTPPSETANDLRYSNASVDSASVSLISSITT